jgi:choline kinase
MSVADAIILAAGMGTRLRAVVDDRPKGLIEIGGQSLVGRSVSLLRSAGVRRVTIVAGYSADAYQRFARETEGVDVVLNDAFASTGSMASLAIGLDAVGPRNVLVLESDIAFEARALKTIQAGPPNATLMSGPTDAGDEVWVSAPNGRLAAMSKQRADLPSVAGEFVGITRLSAPASAAMRFAFERFTASNGHGRMDYETGALVEVAARHPMAALLIPDLCWGEIDDERQYARVVGEVWPAIARG